MKRIVLLLAAAASCAPARPMKTDPLWSPWTGKVEYVEWSGAPGEELVIEQAIVPLRTLIEGEIATVTLKIRNRSDRFVFLRALEDAAAGASLTWQSSRRGGLRYEKENDWYVYDPRAANSEGSGETPALFNTGLIVPAIVEGGKTYFDEQEIGFRIRLIDLPRSFKLSYWVVPMDFVRQEVYFPLSINPTAAADEAKRADRFQRPTEGFLQRYVRERSIGDFSSALRKDAFLLWTESAAYSEWILQMRINPEVPPQAFSREEAARAAEIREPARTTYCARLGGWVLEGPDGWIFASPTRKVRLPDLDPQLFFELDLRKGLAEIQFLEETQLLFEEAYGHRPGDPQRDIRKIQTGVLFGTESGEGLYRHYLLLPDERLPEFLEIAGRDRRLRLSSGPGGVIRIGFR